MPSSADILKARILVTKVLQFVVYNFLFNVYVYMAGLLPKLETIYDPDRRNDTMYGGAVLIKTCGTT